VHASLTSRKATHVPHPDGLVDGTKGVAGVGVSSRKGRRSSTTTADYTKLQRHTCRDWFPERVSADNVHQHGDIVTLVGLLGPWEAARHVLLAALRVCLYT